MTLAELLENLPPAGLGNLAFPRRLLGAFRRKSITFCTGPSDETSVVYWFQSKTFTIDLRLPDGGATRLPDRQGWVGDTLWNPDREELSWSIGRSYQPRNQWPEPASFRFIGNSLLEFAPSGAYVEDWRQQSSRGPLLGLRLVSMRVEETGQTLPMAGGLILAGEHAAYVQSRLPHVDEALRSVADLDQALADGIATEQEIESYEVSVAVGGRSISHSTQAFSVGKEIASDEIELQADGFITFPRIVDGRTCLLRFALDVHVPDFIFDRQTTSSAEAQRWMEDEKHHLFRHAALAF